MFSKRISNEPANGQSCVRGVHAGKTLPLRQPRGRHRTLKVLARIGMRAGGRTWRTAGSEAAVCDDVRVVSVPGRDVVYECCPGYMKMDGLRGCPAGTTSPPQPLVEQRMGGWVVH